MIYAIKGLICTDKKIYLHFLTKNIWKNKISLIYLQQNMKIELDKYYTPTETANHCYDKVLEMVDSDNITEDYRPPEH